MVSYSNTKKIVSDQVTACGKCYWRIWESEETSCTFSLAESYDGTHQELPKSVYFQSLHWFPVVQYPTLASALKAFEEKK